MRKYILALSFMAAFLAAKAQHFNIDSLMHIAKTAANDKIRMAALESFDDSGNIDSLMLFARRLIAYGQAHRLPHAEAFGYDELGYAFYRMGNLIQFQTNVLKASAILDKYPDNFLQGGNANLYAFFQPTDSLQIYYEKEAIAYIASASKDENQKIFLAALFTNLSGIFLRENGLDSALAYAQKGYDIIISDSIAYASGESAITASLSLIHSRLQQYDLAKTYAKMSLEAAQKYQRAEDIAMAYYAMATCFMNTHQQDSAFYYMAKTYNLPSTSTYGSKIRAAYWLYEYYRQKRSVDSALKYAGVYIVGNDSLNNAALHQQVEKINLQENLHRQQLALQQEKENERDKHNIQFVLIAIGIFLCVMLFLLMSRSFLVSHKTIEILSVIILLIVFEFINLLLHDYIEGVTHHSPFLMLLILVVVAGLIVPLHHRLEQWATKKLVEKNKKVRLAKAKKIMEQLG